MPIFVWVLEGLASCKAQLREKEDEAEREKAEREELLERYQAEKTLRKESQEVRNDRSCYFELLFQGLYHRVKVCKINQNGCLMCLTLVSVRNTWSWMTKSSRNEEP